MSILTWIFLGLISGFIASKLVGGGGGLLADMVLGIVGALVGGALVLSVFRFFRRRTSSSY
jgi:uncharacterized membrane protein YeaQ/YmgE (transglycosylase-associated protein family)